MKQQEGKRWSGADWADQQRNIMIVGAGGIGSWLSLSLSRIDHNLYIVDPDDVDTTNVQGGQFYKRNDVNKNKAEAVVSLCREFGATTNKLYDIPAYFDNETGILPITMTGLDNMSARKDVWKEWKSYVNSVDSSQKANFLLMDGRLLLEQMEVFTVRGDDELAQKEYEEKWLFDDSEVEEAACTTKQSTFAAMMIAGMMTSTLCNWLTNRKMGEEFREVPFHQSFFLPTFMHKTYNPTNNGKETTKDQEEVGTKISAELQGSDVHTEDAHTAIS